MKKLIVILAIGLMGYNVNAQVNYGPGVKAGANFATLSGDDADNVKMLVRFYAGFFYNLRISENFSFQPELVYSAQGAKDKTTDEKLKLSYINFTGLFRYNSLTSGFFVGTGPQFGFLLSAKAVTGSSEVDVEEFFKSFDFAWAFALGFEMESGFGIYGRYNLGLANISDTDADLKNNVIQLGLRYMIGTRRD